MLFISHDQEDQAPLSQLRLIVKLAGIECWNPDAMQAGLLLREQLRQAIRECDVCLFLATRRSLGSSWCRAELGAFWGAGKRVISLLQDAELTDSDLPPQLQGDLWTRNAERALEAIREEITVARARSPLRDAEVKRAVCLIGSRESVLATGYLAASDVVVCPDYCVKDPGERLTVELTGRGAFPAELALVDESAGTALLRLEAPMEGIVPLRLALLCHKSATSSGSLPHARHGVSARRARPWIRYSVAIEVGTWRSGRTGSPPRCETSG